jgi:branched-subunit amino acid aminotransferase/4-amino-4-deoxychorismate lyase
VPFAHPQSRHPPGPADSGCLIDGTELATSNIFMAKDGVVFTQLPNGTFLSGITRQRVIGLLRAGNYSKVVLVTRIGDRALPFGPLYTKARELYWAFAHSSSVGVSSTSATKM